MAMAKARYCSEPERRRRDLAAIHAGRNQLGMDEDTYRTMIARVSASVGVSRRSSAELTARQRHAVLDELRRLGATRPDRTAYPGRPPNAAAGGSATLLKIEAQLTDMRMPWSYADAIAQRMFGVERVGWLRGEDQLGAVVAALHVEQEKRGLNAAVDALLKQLNWPPERVVELLRTLRPNWRRHRASLRLVREYLLTRMAEHSSRGSD